MRKKNQKSGSPQSQFLLYQTEDGQTHIEVRLENETVWLSQKLLAELFQKDIRTINEHIKNICDEGELEQGSTIRKFRIVQTEGKRKVARNVDYFNLDVIISVGYRVKSHRGTQFRIWATQRLREYIIKGFTMDDDVPEGLSDNEDAQALYGNLKPLFEITVNDKAYCEKVTTDFANALLNIFDNHKKVHFWDDADEQKSAMNDIDDFLYDEIKNKCGIDLSTEQMDEIIERSMQLARNRRLI